MQSESSWAANNRRRYDAYSLRGRKGLHYPPQPAFVRAPRRGPVPGPIRNPINSYRTAPATSSRINILKKTTSCPNNAKTKCNITPQIPKLVASKKSLSMVDLSPVAVKLDAADLSRSESAASLQGRSRKVNGNLEIAAVPSSDVALWTRGLFPEGEASMVPGVKSRAASLVCRALVVNAWRRRREENFQLNETIRQFTQQVQHLHIQIVVLRRLLDTENGRVGRLMAEMQQAKLRLEDVARERDHLKLEKEKALQDVSQLRDAVEKRTVSAENLRNELLSAQTHLAALDGQVSKDREKLLKLREDKKMLLEKVMISETLASERLAMKETADSEIEDLRGRLSAQIALLSTTNEQQSKIVEENKLKTKQTIKLQKQLQVSQEAGKFLTLRATNLENELADRDAALRRLETAYNSQLSELNDLRERLNRQSQEGGWSSRVLQIAGSVVRAPRAILRTLSFLSNPAGPSPVTS